MNETKALAIHVLKWLDRNNLGDTSLREVMDLVGNYKYALEDAIKEVASWQTTIPMVWIGEYKMTTMTQDQNAVVVQVIVIVNQNAVAILQTVVIVRRKNNE